MLSLCRLGDPCEEGGYPCEDSNVGRTFVRTEEGRSISGRTKGPYVGKNFQKRYFEIERFDGSHSSHYADEVDAGDVPGNVATGASASSAGLPLGDLVLTVRSAEELLQITDYRAESQEAKGEAGQSGATRGWLSHSRDRYSPLERRRKE